MNINTTSNEKFNKEIWDVLEEINLDILRAKNGTLLIKFKNNPLSVGGSTFSESREAILEKLKNDKALNIIKNPLEYAGIYTLNNPTTARKEEDIKLFDYIKSDDTIFLKILQPKFDEVYEKYKKLNKKSKVSIENNIFFVFCVTKDGTLSRKDKINGDSSYKMGAGKLRHRCLVELSRAQKKNELFYHTNELANVLNTTEDKIRDAIAGIKIQIEKNFQGIRRDDFIESAKNSGYRLHKQIRIIQT